MAASASVSLAVSLRRKHYYTVNLLTSYHSLHLGHLQLLALSDGVSLILLAPALSFTLSLGSQAKNILATSGLLIEGLASAIKLMLQVPL